MEFPENQSWTEVTWLQLYVVPPRSQSRRPKFQSDGETEVFQSRPEKTEETEIQKDGCTSLIYELILSYMMRSYKYSWECMYLRKRKIIR